MMFMMRMTIVFAIFRIFATFLCLENMFSFVGIYFLFVSSLMFMMSFSVTILFINKLYFSRNDIPFPVIVIILLRMCFVTAMVMMFNLFTFLWFIIVFGLITFFPSLFMVTFNFRVFIIALIIAKVILSSCRGSMPVLLMMVMHAFTVLLISTVRCIMSVMTVWFLLIMAPTFPHLFGKMGFIAIVTVNIIIRFFEGEMMMMMMTFAGDDIVSYFLVFVMRVVCFRIRLWFFTFVLSLISQFSITVLSFLFKAIRTRDMLLFVRTLRVLLPRFFTLFLFR